MAKNILINFGYNNSKIINLEALRFLYLNNVTSSDNNSLKYYTDTHLILIAGDYDNNSNISLLNIFSKVKKSLRDRFQIIFKPHPGSDSLLQFDFSNFNVIQVEDPMSDLLNDCDILCSSNSTSTSIEAYLVNKKVLVFLDKNQLNLSPLKNVPGVLFFSNQKELEYCLEKLLSSITTDVNQEIIDSLFNLDHELPRWKNLLNSYI
jgi:surface carbohydrate biosynthesis protein (TIGR04326 family)